MTAASFINVLGLSYRLRHFKNICLAEGQYWSNTCNICLAGGKGGGGFFCFSAVKLAGKVAFMTDAGNGENCSNFVISRMEAP